MSTIDTPDNMFFTLVAYCDPGADCDDQPMMEAVLRKQAPGTKIMMIIGGTGRYAAWEEYAKGKEFPDNHVTWIRENAMVPEHFTAQKLLICAPGWDTRVGRCFASHDVAEVCFQGNLPCRVSCKGSVLCPFPDTSPAFNDKGSEQLLQGLPNECTIRVVTSKECLQPKNLLTVDKMRALGFNEENILFTQKTTFGFLVGRMHPEHAYNHVAQGLIHPGVKGTFYMLAKAMTAAAGLSDPPKIAGSRDLPHPKELSAEQCSDLGLACLKYVADLGAAATKPDLCGYLYELQCMVYMITGIFPVRSCANTLVLSGDVDGTNFDLAEDFPNEFARFCSMDVYAPPYDYLAYVASGF